MNTFSANSLKTFKKSSSEFYERYILNISAPQDDKSAKLGKDLHLLISYKLKGFDIEKIENNIKEPLKSYWNSIKEDEILKLKTLDVESSFCVKLDSYWLKGRFDAVFADNQKIIIADWKTGKIPPENDLQTIVYLYCASKLYKNENLSIIFYSLKDKTKKIIDFNPGYSYQTVLRNDIEEINKFLKYNKS